MPPFGDRPLVGRGSELQLTIDDRAVPHDEILAAVEVLDAEQLLSRAPAGEETIGEVGERLLLEPENLYAAGERIALRAASPSTRRQYGSIYRAFGDWLRAELGRPPTTADLGGDSDDRPVREPREPHNGRAAEHAEREAGFCVDPEDQKRLAVVMSVKPGQKQRPQQHAREAQPQPLLVSLNPTACLRLSEIS